MSRVKWLFIGPDGLRNGCRFLVFASAIFLVVRFLEQPAITFLEAKLHVDPNALSAPSRVDCDPKAFRGHSLDLRAALSGSLAFARRGGTQPFSIGQLHQ